MTEAVKTTREPHEIIALPYREQVQKGKTAIINIRVADKDKMTVPTASNRLFFEVSGAGEFIGCGNGDPGDHDSDFKPERNAFNGLCQLLVKATNEGQIKVTVKSDGLMPGECIVSVNE